MLAAAVKAINQILSPPFRNVLLRSLAITVALLFVVWVSLQALLGAFVDLPYPWMDAAIAIFAGLGLLVGMAFLVGPITSLVAGLFLDEIAAHVEASDYPDDPPGRELPLARSLFLSVKFALVVLAANIVALFLLLLPGVNLVAFLVANGYLLGREYFELAALRHMPEAEAKRLRRANGVQVFLGGLVIAGLLAIPLVNLLTPLFATAFMVHLFKRVERPQHQARVLAS
ncbi:MAG TPA: sulfate transporter family protein [Hyphomicrobiales bacterium]|nr:sulfate transporter family protein [Hyphomicrobiales bacterium]